jgi:Tfp pilus assembly protein PilF
MDARNDADGAEREWRAALRIDPNDVDSHWNLHRVYCTKGDREGAMHEVREFIRCGGRPGVDGEARLAQLQRSAC